MYDWLKSGDVVAFKGKWGVNHVGILAPVFGEQVLYEAYEGEDRPPCLRTQREQPVGVQAHRLGPMFDTHKVVIYPYCRPLYPEEEDRLLALLEDLKAHNRDYCVSQVAETQRGKYWNSELVATVLAAVGMARRFPRPGTIRPARLVRKLVRQGFYKDGIAII